MYIYYNYRYCFLFDWVVVEILAPYPTRIPIPIPGVSKSLLPVGKQMKTKQMFDSFL